MEDLLIHYSDHSHNLQFTSVHGTDSGMRYVTLKEFGTWRVYIVGPLFGTYKYNQYAMN
jgi:hypothetical protein